MDIFSRPLIRITALFFALAVAETGWLHTLLPLENRLSDFFVRQQGQKLAPDPQIAIVDIDDASLARMQDVAGNWPWPRAVHGELVRGIAAQRPAAIVFDILFSERDQYRPESDRLFNEALNAADNIYFPMIRRDPALDADGALLARIAPMLGLTRTAGAPARRRASRCCRRWGSTRATGAAARSTSRRTPTAWGGATGSTPTCAAGWFHRCPRASLPTRATR